MANGYSNFIYFIVGLLILYAFYFVFIRNQYQHDFIAFVLSSICILALIWFTSIQNIHESTYDLNLIIGDMKSSELDNKEYNLDVIKQEKGNLYYFYEPLSQEEIENEFVALSLYHEKYENFTQQVTDSTIAYVYGFDYQLDNSDQFIDLYKNNLNKEYQTLMSDAQYNQYLWNTDMNFEKPKSYYFLNSDNHIVSVVINSVYRYFSNDIKLEDISLLDKEMFVRKTKFEIWIASKTRSEIDLNEYPEVSFDE